MSFYIFPWICFCSFYLSFIPVVLFLVSVVWCTYNKMVISLIDRYKIMRKQCASSYGMIATLHPYPLPHTNTKKLRSKYISCVQNDIARSLYLNTTVCGSFANMRRRLSKLLMEGHVGRGRGCLLVEGRGRRAGRRKGKNRQSRRNEGYSWEHNEAIKTERGKKGERLPIKTEVRKGKEKEHIDEDEGINRQG